MALTGNIPDLSNCKLITFANCFPEHRRRVADLGTQLSNAIEHVKAAFGDGQELTILITELTRSSICGNFIQAAKVESYYQATKGLQLTQRETEIVEQISMLDLAV